MLVTWLLDKANKGGHRTDFMRYIRTALADRQGDSSTAFDRVMGKPIELFDEPWRVWLNELAGN